MNQAQIKIFIATAEASSFTKAAKQFFITQAAVTQHIRALENALGCELFDRRTRPIHLTPAGRAFYLDAKNLIKEMDSAISHAKGAANGVGGNLHIGFAKGYERSGLSASARRFHRDNAGAFLTFECRSSDQLAAELLQGKFDMIYTWDSSNLRQNPEVAWQPADKIRLMVALYSGHPLAGKIQLDRADIQGEDLLYLSPLEDPSTFGDAVFVRLYQEAGYRPNIVYRTTDLEVIMTMISAEEGISILPDYAANTLKGADNLIFVPLGGEQREEIDVIWRKDNQNPLLPAWLSQMKDEKRVL